MSQDQHGKFKARAYFLDDDTLVDLETWYDGLVPMGERRGDDEWALDSLRNNYSVKDLREQLGVPEGNYQVYFEGRIHGYFSQPSDEWDEDIDFTNVVFEKMPDEWTNERFGSADDE